MRKVIVFIALFLVLAASVSCATPPSSSSSSTALKEAVTRVDNLETKTTTISATLTQLQKDVAAVGKPADVSAKLDKSVYDTKMTDLNSILTSLKTVNDEQAAKINDLTTRLKALEDWKTAYVGSGTGGSGSGGGSGGSAGGSNGVTITYDQSPPTIIGSTSSTSTTLTLRFKNTTGQVRYFKPELRLDSQNSVVTNISSAVVALTYPTTGSFTEIFSASQGSCTTIRSFYDGTSLILDRAGTSGDSALLMVTVTLQHGAGNSTVWLPTMNVETRDVAW